MKDMLKLDKVSVNYENKAAIKNLSLELQGDRVYALVGKSGSGKTTLAKAVAGILPYGGAITLNGEKLDAQKHRIALVPQNHGLIPWKTVAENIALPLKERKVYDAAAFKTVAEELGISHLLKAWPNHISGGEQQRVAMARGFLARPHVLILDEAFSALDAITKEEAHNTFLKVFDRHRVTTLLITHDVEEAIALGHTLVVLGDGEITKVFANPCRGMDRDEDYSAFLALRRRIKEAL
ncbi:MAG: ABC transporter ATP-binding protein [Bacillota bacterium]|nr:ABC transporter ATP-binding protein [Bacillota bacterium]